MIKQGLNTRKDPIGSSNGSHTLPKINNQKSCIITCASWLFRDSLGILINSEWHSYFQTHLGIYHCLQGLRLEKYSFQAGVYKGPLDKCCQTIQNSSIGPFTHSNHIFPKPYILTKSSQILLICKFHFYLSLNPDIVFYQMHTFV